MDFPHLGCPVGVGGCALPWGVGPAGRRVRTVGKYLDPAGDSDLYGPRSRHMGYKNFWGPSSWLGGARVHERLGDLRSSSRCVSARHLGLNLPLGICGWGLTSVVTLAWFGLTTGFPARSS